MDIEDDLNELGRELKRNEVPQAVVLIEAAPRVESPPAVHQAFHVGQQGLGKLTRRPGRHDLRLIVEGAAAVYRRFVEMPLMAVVVAAV